MAQNNSSEVLRESNGKTQGTQVILESKRAGNYARPSHLRLDNDYDSDDKIFNECLFRTRHLHMSFLFKPPKEI